MGAVIDKRTADTPRVPLDALVELVHEGFESPLEADAINVSARGLSMRASYLPDVGSTLSCRFECPPGGRPVEVLGEVVWTHEREERASEFGLRFTSLRYEDATAIQGLIASQDLRTDADTDDESAVKIFLDGVATPIHANTTESTSGWVVAEQELPFLKLGTSVTLKNSDDTSQRGSIQSVTLHLEGDTPKLVLGVSCSGDSGIVRAPVALADGAESTWPDLNTPWGEPSNTQSDTEASELEAGDRQLTLPEVDERSYDVELTKPRQSAVPHLRLDEPDEDDGELRLEVQEQQKPGQRVAAELRSKLQAATPFAKKASSAIAVILRSFFMWLGAATRKLQGPMSVFARRLSITTARLRGKDIDAPRRRVQRAPSRTEQQAATRVAPRRTQASTSPQRSPFKLRFWLVAFALVVSVSWGVYALSRPTEAPAKAATAPSSSEQMQPLNEQPATPEPSVAASAPAAVPSVAPAAQPANDPAPIGASDPQAVPPSVNPSEAPRAMPEPSYEEGRIPPPSYPTAPQTATEAAAPGVAPAASPYAAEPRLRRSPAAQKTSGNAIKAGPVHSSTVFGQKSVAHGKTFTLRMSRPVTNLQGTVSLHGITVVIPKALALDKAGPIAAAHPMVESAKIINQGERSELTIRFRPGRHPAYRVAARGAALEIVIGNK